MRHTPDTIRRLVLIGFRGAGKSTLATHLAPVLGWPVHSTDEAVERAAGVPIAQVVKEQGWPAFREWERRVLEEMTDVCDVIIDCGGGVPEYPDAIRWILNDALVVWVQAELDDIVSRLRRAPRPLLSSADPARDITENLARRIPIYQRYAHLSVNTSKLTIEQAVNAIVKATGFG